ncbi:tRNA (adenosine(37)-N6)-dimethylallyltransferase MiaA [Pseudofrancisella aestuarii]|uniref:tRNA dimethylallyltransferase n=1 Tax=Pseudofrancisella aestuarii TaxID=2670347 RepID=A0ABV9T9K2_9GAMM|nr:tRNA (adenosine(37)-N6)-dimethylallyltransferase MiaA [Pseudofrancisella aestuarii]
MSNLIYGIAGPTASGKTSLSISIAKKINAEIISVDSSLVYKRMDIGTAKPSLDEREGVKHHLIDIIEPWQNFSVADFISNVNLLKNDIHSRDKNVLLVGGTMLYFKGLIEGLSILPESDVTIRKSLEEYKNKYGLSYLYKELEIKDSEAARKINPNDQQRIFRALEVINLSGSKYSELIKNSREGALEEELRLCAIIPKDRAILHRNIEERFSNMLSSNFLDEVRSLKTNPLLTNENTAIRSVGYRQAWDYLDNKVTYEEFINKGIAATRQLAKRQLTWLRNWKDNIFFVNMEDEDKELKILNFFNSP